MSITTAISSIIIATSLFVQISTLSLGETLNQNFENEIMLREHGENCTTNWGMCDTDGSQFLVCKRNTCQCLKHDDFVLFFGAAGLQPPPQFVKYRTNMDWVEEEQSCQFIKGSPCILRGYPIPNGTLHAKCVDGIECIPLEGDDQFGLCGTTTNGVAREVAGNYYLSGLCILSFVFIRKFL